MIQCYLQSNNCNISGDLFVNNHLRDLKSSTSQVIYTSRKYSLILLLFLYSTMSIRFRRTYIINVLHVQVGRKMEKMLVKRQEKQEIKKLVVKNLHHLALAPALHSAPKIQVFSGYLRCLGTAVNVDLKDSKAVTKIRHS